MDINHLLLKCFSRDLNEIPSYDLFDANQMVASSKIQDARIRIKLETFDSLADLENRIDHMMTTQFFDYNSFTTKLGYVMDEKPQVSSAKSTDDLKHAIPLLTKTSTNNTNKTLEKRYLKSKTLSRSIHSIKNSGIGKQIKHLQYI